MKIAIIGAGFSALTCATLLKQHYGEDISLTLFEKSRGVGGRMATRYHDNFYFDHGAQFFYVKTPEFADFLVPLQDAEIIAPWTGRFREYQDTKCTLERQWSDSPVHYVGVPNMNAVGKYLAQNLNIHTHTRVTRMTFTTPMWELYSDDTTLGQYDWVILTTPTPQTLELLPQHIPCYNELQTKKMIACYSLMIGFDAPHDFGFDSALLSGQDVSWISVNSSKPGRNTKLTTLLIHSTNAYAEAHIDDDKELVISHLLGETEQIIGSAIHDYAHIDIHGWKYANAPKQTGATHYLDIQHQVGICGDSLIQGRVESAFSSSYALTAELISKDYFTHATP